MGVEIDILWSETGSRFGENRAAHPHQEFPAEKSWLFVSIARK